MLKSIKLLSFLVLILMWVNLEVSTFGRYDLEAMKKEKNLESVSVPPFSTDVQVLAEALYLDMDHFNEWAPSIREFPSKKRTAVDVCELSKKDAMEYCLKLDRMYERVDDYSLIPGGEVEECIPYQVVYFHCTEYPNRTMELDTVRARKCPFQPNELFITSGNRRMPAYALTWLNADKKYLHVDHYIYPGYYE